MNTDLSINDIIETCHKINTKLHIHFGEVQDVYESKDGQMRYYINRKNGIAYLYATQERGKFWVLSDCTQKRK